jgi:hypothetical protein
MTTSRSSGPQIVCFDVYEADLRSGELRKQGLRVRLPEQPFQLLAILLEHAGDVVTREDLPSRTRVTKSTPITRWVGDTSIPRRVYLACAGTTSSQRTASTLQQRYFGFFRRVDRWYTTVPQNC